MKCDSLSHEEIMKLPPGIIQQIAEQCVQEVFINYNRMPLPNSLPVVIQEANRELMKMGGSGCPLLFHVVPGLSPGEIVILAKNLYTELALMRIFIPPEILNSAEPEKTFFSVQTDRGGFSASLKELRTWFMDGTLRSVLS